MGLALVHFQKYWLLSTDLHLQGIYFLPQRNRLLCFLKSKLNCSTKHLKELQYLLFIAIGMHKRGVESCHFAKHVHTTQNSQNKRTKISDLEANIFKLKMMVKIGLEFLILKFYQPLQRYLLTCQANSAVLGRSFCTGQQQL